MMRVRVAVLLCLATAGVFVAGCSDDDDSGEEQTLTFTEGKGGDFHPIGNPSEGRVPAGSGFALTVPLSGDDGSGDLRAVCIATENSTQEINGTCTATVVLDGGQLALNVGGKIGEAVSGSIVGGNGDYAGATGTFDSTGDNPTTDTFKFTLP